jgi:hypothetical protein
MNYKGWALIQTRSDVLLLLFPTSFLAGLMIFSILAGSFTVSASMSHAHAQLQKVQDVNTSTMGTIPALAEKKQQQSTQEVFAPKLHLVKILLPAKGQLALISKNITMSGT